MSLMGRVYQSVYEALCGRHPQYRPWHYQWLFLRGAHAWQRAHMKNFHAQVLDVGCGEKPYRTWVVPSRVERYVGLDVTPNADIVVRPGQPWPIADGTVDCVLFTQVMEHLGDRAHVLSEIKRVLKVGGVILLTVPFLFPAHGEPYDYIRLTHQGCEQIFAGDYEIIENITTGGFGTVLSTLILSWVENSLNTNVVTRIFKGIALPFWLMLALTLNGLGLLLDRVDFSGTHYANVCMLAKKG